MNEKYIIGVAIGFAAAYVLLQNRQSVITPSPTKVKIPQTRMPQMPSPRSLPAPAIGVRPWPIRRPLYAAF